MSCLIKKNDKKDVVGQQKNIFGRGHNKCVEGDRPCNEGGGCGGEGYTRHAKIKTKLEWHGISNIIFEPEMGQTPKKFNGKTTRCGSCYSCNTYCLFLQHSNSSKRAELLYSTLDLVQSFF